MNANLNILALKDELTREEAMQVFQALERPLERPTHKGHWAFDVIKGGKLKETPGGLVVVGGEIVQSHEQVCESWTRNFYNIVIAQLGSVNATDATTFGDGHINLKDDGGTIRGTTAYAPSILPADAYVITDEDRGIVVGTGNTAESFEDYQMDSLVAHGSGSGELIYSRVPYPTMNWDSGARTWEVIHRRYFTNSSGGTIVLAEVGLKARCYYTTSYCHCIMARDVLAATVNVTDGGIVRSRYTITTAAFPS